MDYNSIYNEVKDIRKKLIRSTVIHLFTLFHLIFAITASIIGRSYSPTIAYTAITYFIIFLIVKSIELKKITTHIIHNNILKAKNAEEIELYLHNVANCTEPLISSMTMEIGRLRTEIKKHSEFVKISQSISTVYNKSTIKIFFTIIIMLTLFFTANASIFYYYLYHTDDFDMAIFFTLFKWASFVGGITMGAMSYLLYKIAFGTSDTNICSYCRRIKWNHDWHTLEHFIGRASHDICPMCTSAFIESIEVIKKAKDD